MEIKNSNVLKNNLYYSEMYSGDLDYRLQYGAVMRKK